MDSSDSWTAVAAISTTVLYAATGCHNHPAFQVSHVHFVSLPSCHPVLRRQVRCTLTPATCASMPGFAKSDRLPTCTCVTTLDRVRLMLRPKGRLNPCGPLSPGFRKRNRFRSCRSGFGANRSLPRQIPYNLLDTSPWEGYCCLWFLPPIRAGAAKSWDIIPTVNKAPRGTPYIPHTLVRFSD